MAGLSPNPPHAVLFDWDNTLVDSWPVIAEALNATRIAFGLDGWSAAQVQQGVGHSLRDTFPAWFGARWQDARAHYLSAFEAMHIERLAVLPGAAALLDHLADQGAVLGIVSNKTGRLLRAEVAALGWTTRFHAIIGAQDAPADKPDPAPLHLALAGSGIAAGPKVWFVGDAFVDIEIAAATGCRAILVGNSWLSAEKPDHVPHLPDLPALLRWIRECC